MTKRVIMFSGGIGSWGAAQRVADRFGTSDLTLLFCDTLIEDEDLYRFRDEAAFDIFGGTPSPNQFVCIAEGRTPWQVFDDEGMIGNSGADLCSRILKREFADQWLVANRDPADTVIYVGMDWTEQHRFDDGQGHGAKNRYARLGWRCEAPLCDPPFVWRHQLLDELKKRGIKPPRLYAMGFPHNNCGGFCIKAGHAAFQNLLEKLPGRFEYHADQERKFRQRTGKNVSVLKDRRGGRTVPLPLDKFRDQIKDNQWKVDPFDFGGCGCFSEDE